ncbi:MAG: tyrosine-type recombinase/integrase [Pelodictyon phaeoclathratiforme]|nr:tyrosine-type recombinase/integrase [Pelodictyon phaeoclathratiforme]
MIGHLWCKREEIAKPISFNCTRHTFATLCLSAGMPLKVVSDYLCHKLNHADGGLREAS